MTRRADVIVIGAGLHGASAALHLAQRGRRVIMLDKEEGGRHSSCVNAGGLRLLARHPAEIPLALEAMQIWRSIGDLVGDDCGLRWCGHLKVAENEAELKRIDARLTLMRSLGYDHEVFIDRQELGSLVPDIAPHCRGAIMSRGDGYASPARSMRAFQRAAESAGVGVFRGQRVTSIDRTANGWKVYCGAAALEAPQLVNCAGAWGDQIARLLGDDIAIVAEAPMMMVTAPLPRLLHTVLGAIGRKLSLKQLPNGAVLIGGGYRGSLDRDTGETHVDFKVLAESARTVTTLLPCLSNAPIVRAWAGIEGMTPDGLPVLGPSPNAAGAFHAFAFCSHGFLLGPVVGRLISDLIVDGRSSLPLQEFAPQRLRAAVRGAA
ncbi:MAG: NAD(P)/FAD-dependent oxidoreductase [Steroidobacteraceae bacterium]